MRLRAPGVLDCREPQYSAGGRLGWRCGGGGGSTKRPILGGWLDLLQRAPGCVDTFGERTVVAILGYARPWGPLWLCPVHSLPWGHDPECTPSSSDWQRDEDDIELTDEELDRLRPEDPARRHLPDLV